VAIRCKGLDQSSVAWDLVNYCAAVRTGVLDGVVRSYCDVRDTAM
jgi:hypothetical protein